MELFEWIRRFTVPIIPFGKYRLAENFHYIYTEFLMIYVVVQAYQVIPEILVFS